MEYHFHDAFFAVSVREGVASVRHTDWADHRHGGLAFIITLSVWVEGGRVRIEQLGVEAKTDMGDITALEAGRLIHSITHANSRRIVLTCFTDNSLYAACFTTPERLAEEAAKREKRKKERVEREARRARERQAIKERKAARQAEWARKRAVKALEKARNKAMKVKRAEEKRAKLGKAKITVAEGGDLYVRRSTRGILRFD
jgi:hypothetical protein